MSRPPSNNRTPTKDMYWFAHGGIESSTDKCLNQKNTVPGECEEEGSESISPTLRFLLDRRGLPDEQKPAFNLNSVDSVNSSGPSSLEITDRNRNLDKHIAAEERRKQLWEAEQERNDAVLRKHMERGAALEARRNAQRSTISFAFGSSVPRNVESLQGGDSEKISRHSNASGLSHKEENHELSPVRRSVSPFYSSGYNLQVDGTSPLPNSSHSNVSYERKTFSPPCWLVGSGALIGDDVMSRSMTAAVPAPRGRRKNDLMPTVPYDRTATPKSSSSGSTRKRSVSMTRLDQLAQPRRHYVEATKASSTVSSGASSMHKDNIKSPTRPLSSASEQSGGSGRLGSSVTRRVRSSPRKPRPVSIAGTVPDHKPLPEFKVSPVKKSTVSKKPVEVRKAPPLNSKPAVTKSTEKSKSVVETMKPSVEKAKPAPRSTPTPKSTKQPSVKQSTPSKTASPKTLSSKKTVTNKKKADIMTSSQSAVEIAAVPLSDVIKSASPPPASPPPPESTAADFERNNAKRIISEEEAKAALAEKRRLAREQAEKEAELERQRQEELRLQEEERLRLEEEEQRRMEEEQLHLIEEHRRLEDEKLRKAIEENERKEEEERQKREEEQRLKAEQEKKAQEEAEKQRIELEEKLRKEEEERAERKKRLEKIMSRTRGKTSGTSPSGSISGSEHFDSSENQHENVSSGANSLDSTGTGEMPSGPASLECPQDKLEPISDGASMEAHPTYEVASDNESLVDIIMPKSETASQDNSLDIIPTKDEWNLVVESNLNDANLISSEASQLQVEDVVVRTELAEQYTEYQGDKIGQEDSKNEFSDNFNRVINTNNEMQEVVEENVDIMVAEDKANDSKTVEVVDDKISENVSVQEITESKGDDNEIILESVESKTSNSEIVQEYVENKISINEVVQELEDKTIDSEISKGVEDAEISDVEAIKEIGEIEISDIEPTKEVSEFETTDRDDIKEVEDKTNDSEIEVGEDKTGQSETVEVVEGKISDNNIIQVVEEEMHNSEIIQEFEQIASDSEAIHEVVEQISSSVAPMLETTQITSTAFDSEAALIDHAEVILSFEQEKNMEISSNVDFTSIPQFDTFVQPSEASVIAEADAEEVEVEQNSHFSTSSDIKLPDPIYETSDDGSVSSEKHQQDFGFNEDQPHHESQPILDEVFNEKEFDYSEKMFQNSNPFEKPSIENSSNLMAAYESQFEIGGMQDSIYAYETSDNIPDVVEQPREIEEENVYATRSSTSSVPEVENLGDFQPTSNAFLDFDGNKENVESDIPFQNSNPFASDNDFTVNRYEADKENMQFISPGDVSEDVLKNQVLPESANSDNPQAQDSIVDAYFMQQQFSVLEQTNFDNQPALTESSSVPSDDLKFGDVTIIKAEGSGDCIGIISSIDNDHISNDLVKQSMQSELLKSNFEYSSITDSEDSSLDSNLSQVMTVEVNDKNSVGLNQIENGSSESTVVLSNNVLAEIPFNDPAVNGNSTSNGDHYPETEVLSNGHRLESANSNLEEISGYVQLDSKHISSVDHSKTNIFDNVDAVDFGKISPDPFLAKGTSNQISGNPFLLQDDQKQVLMTPDFFN